MLKAKSKESELSTFWINLLEEYPEIAAQALKLLIRFPTTYLCEKTFSLYAATKTKYRNRLNVENYMKLQVTSIMLDCESLATINNNCTLVIKFYFIPYHLVICPYRIPLLFFAIAFDCLVILY